MGYNLVKTESRYFPSEWALSCTDGLENLIIGHFRLNDFETRIYPKGYVENLNQRLSKIAGKFKSGLAQQAFCMLLDELPKLERDASIAFNRAVNFRAQQARLSLETMPAWERARMPQIPRGGSVHGVIKYYENYGYSNVDNYNNQPWEQARLNNFLMNAMAANPEIFDMIMQHPTIIDRIKTGHINVKLRPDQRKDSAGSAPAQLKN